MDPIYVHWEEIHNYSAPKQVVPIIMDLVNPKSVLDVGCGLGTWLRIFNDLGVLDFMGVDGDYVNRDLLKINTDHFKSLDLTKSWSLYRKFDLVISLEVAEHLPESSADQFVKSLIEHGDVILFSAAIPGQQGQNHINEQWPAYWESKFNTNGYYFHDVIRPLVWMNDKVDWWYKQNIFLLKKEIPKVDKFSNMPLIHPELYTLRMNQKRKFAQDLMTGKMGLKMSLKILWASLKFRLKLLQGK